MARAEVRLDGPLGTVDRRIFGSFTEHLGCCIYGGLVDEGSENSDAAGFRKDVLAATRDLGVSTVRWPDGNFVSGYHWMDGIGPVAGPARRPELARGAEESNRRTARPAPGRPGPRRRPRGICRCPARR